MKIAILGSRGIPNTYGGFEECATQLAYRLVEKGHELTVYNSSLHEYSESSWRGVEIIHQKDPEELLGTAGQFIFDLNCILHSRKQGFDIILQLGYTSSGIWQWLFPQTSRIVTNMDGLEWSRAKYNSPVKVFLKWSEKLAARKAHQLIGDNPGIIDYLDKNYGVGGVYIPYGTDIPKEVSSEVLKKYGVVSGEFHLLIARMEPENNIRMILKGISESNIDIPTLVIGHKSNSYGRQLKEEFKSSSIAFHPGVFEKEETDALRMHCRRYFHGHSAGGTNPSLLDAMASECLIYAHKNPFNAYVLGDNGRFFSNSDEITEQLNSPIPPTESAIWKKNNLERVRKEYDWESVTDQYELVFQQLLIG